MRLEIRSEHLLEVLHHTLIEAFTAKVSVAPSGNDLENAIVNGDQRDIEGSQPKGSSLSSCPGHTQWLQRWAR